VAPAIVMLLVAGEELVPLTDPKARRMSPTMQSVALALEVKEKGGSRVFLTAWDKQFVGHAEEAAVVGLLLRDAARQISYSKMDMFEGYRLDSTEQAMVAMTFFQFPAFKTALLRVFALAQSAALAAGKAERWGLDVEAAVSVGPPSGEPTSPVGQLAVVKALTGDAAAGAPRGERSPESGLLSCDDFTLRLPSHRPADSAADHGSVLASQAGSHGVAKHECELLLPFAGGSMLDADTAGSVSGGCGGSTAWGR